jgi:hypothetical protein
METNQKIPTSVSLELLPHDDGCRQEIHRQVDNCKPILLHEQERYYQNDVYDLIRYNGQCLAEQHNFFQVCHPGILFG